MPKISMDYFFFSIKDEKASSNLMIVMLDEANMLISEFDVGVNFVPTLVDAQSSALTIRAADHKGKNKAETSRDHALEVAVDVTWNETGRKVSFFIFLMGN